jgi:DNA replication protein DnaC
MLQAYGPVRLSGRPNPRIRTTSITVTSPLAFLRGEIFNVPTWPTCHFLRDARDVLFLGPPGVGKTFLSEALGYLAIRMGHTVLYRSIFDLVREFIKDEAFEGDDRTMAKYLKADLLIIDDMGMKMLPKKSGEFLFEIIMRRHQTRSTIMTSNRPIEEWGKLIGDVPSATAILDRLLQTAEVIEITGKSYRLKDRAAKNGG